MKDLRIAVLGLALLAAAAPLLAGPRLCSNGFPAKLSGDAFSPVECSTAALIAPPLPGLPASPSDKVPADLRDLEGRWDGVLVHALGRYELLLTVKTNWRGRAEITLDSREKQFRDRLTDRLVLVPGKERGSYEATMETSLAPEVTLAGRAVVASSPGQDAPVPDRQTDVDFVNGARHRVVYAFKDKSRSEMRVRAFSAIPGAPPQTIEVVFTKTKKEKL